MNSLFIRKVFCVLSIVGSPVLFLMFVLIDIVDLIKTIVIETFDNCKRRGFVLGGALASTMEVVKVAIKTIKED